jgi:hypothetical protein
MSGMLVDIAIIALSFTALALTRCVFDLRQRVKALEDRAP